MKAHRTLPFDIVMALRLLRSAGTMAELAEELAVAPSQVHSALTRLERAGLLKPGSRQANPRALGEFVLYGARYAFPAERGRIVAGVPTAHSAGALSRLVDATDVVVWESEERPGLVQGFSVAPLYAGAVHLPERSPATYELTTLVDALRLGDRKARG